jgi:hypothetical protein
MKSVRMFSVVAMVISGLMTSYGQVTQSDVPGDNFSLEGALEIFKKSESPEEFEKLLNSADSKVNNLDLNGDGYIDYIRVLDRYEGNVHAFIIQAVISERENQDVAVIELEKLSNGKAVLQIIGDEDIYGVETIIEPTREVRTYAGTTSSPAVVNVWAWPSVQYVYSPYYTGWYSPWGWRHRPVWWRSWRPVAYIHYYPIWHSYRPYYSFCHIHRVVYADRIYRPYRTTSVVVINRHRDQLSRYRSSPRDDYRSRNDDRRSYADNSRSRIVNSYHQRTADPKPDRRTHVGTEDNSRNRSISGERTDLRRNSGELERDDLGERRPVTIESNRDTRQRVTTPVERRSSYTPPVQERSSSGQRTAPAEIRRNSSGLPERREATVPAHHETRTQPNSSSVNRIRSTGPDVQRSGSVNTNRPSMQQRSAPVINRSRSSSSPAVQQRSGGSRSAEGTSRRGRD